MSNKNASRKKAPERRFYLHSPASRRSLFLFRGRFLPPALDTTARNLLELLSEGEWKLLLPADGGFRCSCGKKPCSAYC